MKVRFSASDILARMCVDTSKLQENMRQIERWAADRLLGAAVRALPVGWTLIRLDETRWAVSISRHSMAGAVAGSPEQAIEDARKMFRASGEGE